MSIKLPGVVCPQSRSWRTTWVEMVTSTLMMLLPDPVPDQEHPSDELETLDHLQLDRQLDLGYMTFWSIPN